MPSVTEHLSANVDTAGLQQKLGAQVGALHQAITLAGQLIDGKAPGIDTFIGSLGALRGPGFTAQGNFGAALGNALALVPADLASVVAPASARFAEMATVVDDRLRPLLQDAVKAAQAMQLLLNTRLGCLDGAAGGNAGAPNPVPPPAQPPPAGPAPPSRVAIAAQQIVQLDAVLAALPTPIDASALLQLLLRRLATKSRDTFFGINLPVVDDLLDPLHTLAAWTALDDAGVAAHMVASIDALSLRVRDSAAAPLADLAAALNARAPQWRRAALGAAADAVAAGITALAAALHAADPAATAAALATLNAALDDYDALRAAMNGDVLPAVPALTGALAHLPLTLLDTLTHLLVQLEPTNLAARLTSLLEPFQPVSAQAAQAVREFVQPLIEWLRELLVQLDFGAAQAEIATVAGEAQAIAADITATLTGVALEVQSAFGDVGNAISSIGLTDLRADLSKQIAQFGDQLGRDITRAFAPARNGISTAIGAVSGALDHFDPASLVAPLQQVVNSIAGVLNGAEVKGAIDAVKQAINALVDALKSLSFTPVTDEVIALIEEMRKGLKAIIDQDLSDAVKAALGAAMAVLPGDLHPVTDPLVVDFTGLVDTGPLALLTSVKDAPKQILDSIKRFEPAALIGDQLAAPYRTLVARANGFKVAQLFAAAEGELASVRRRLQQTANPARALEPLRAPLTALSAKLDTFSPAALLTPLTQAVESTIAQIVDAAPVDEILGAINGVFASVRDVLTFAQKIQSVADRVQRLFAAFAAADSQLDSWRDGVLTKVANGANAGLAAALSALNTALDGARHAEVLAAFDAATAAVITELDAVDAAARLNRLVSTYAVLVNRVATLSASATKDAAQQVLTRFNPTHALHSAPLRLATDLRSALTSARTDLAAQAVEWNDTVAGLANLRGVAAGSVRDLVAAAIDPTLQPVRFICTALGNLATPAKGVAQTLAEVVTTLTARVDALVNGPGSLSAISGALQQIVDALRHIDLRFLERSLDEVLAKVRDQLRALDPTSLGKDLDSAFQSALSALSLNTLIPPDEVAALDGAWHAVIAKLQPLDPGALIERTLQPVYDQAVLPLLAAFDLTPAFIALIEFLDALKGELGSGLDRVNNEYQSLLALRPGGGASLSIGG